MDLEGIKVFSVMKLTVFIVGGLSQRPNLDTMYAGATGGHLYSEGRVCHKERVCMCILRSRGLSSTGIFVLSFHTYIRCIVDSSPDS